MRVRHPEDRPNVPVTSGRRIRRAARGGIPLTAAAPSSGDPALRTPHRVPGVHAPDGGRYRVRARIQKAWEVPCNLALSVPKFKRGSRRVAVMSVGPLLANKVVCITGASRGIGRACALECAKHGATGLVLHYYGDEATTKEMNALKEEIESLHTHAKVLGVPGDIALRETSQKVHHCPYNARTVR